MPVGPSISSDLETSWAPRRATPPQRRAADGNSSRRLSSSRRAGRGRSLRGRSLRGPSSARARGAAPRDAVGRFVRRGALEPGGAVRRPVPSVRRSGRSVRPSAPPRRAGPSRRSPAGRRSVSRGPPDRLLPDAPLPKGRPLEVRPPEAALAPEGLPLAGLPPESALEPDGRPFEGRPPEEAREPENLPPELPGGLRPGAPPRGCAGARRCLSLGDGGIARVYGPHRR